MVKFIETKLVDVQNEVTDMWSLVQSQMSKSQEALMAMDTEIAKQVQVREKLVNSYDLKIDSMIEDFIALYNPVAVDLRFLLAMLNVNNNLERIGDYAESIARFVVRNSEASIDKELMEKLHINDMFRHAIRMIETSRRALIERNIELAKDVAEEDNMLDELNADANRIIAEYAGQHPESMKVCLELSNVFRKLERTGDHINNVLEDIIFYINAEVIKHDGKHSDEEIK